MPCVAFAAKWDDSPILEAISEEGRSKISHNMRLLEAETADSYGIAFDRNWYSLDLQSREYMVAARIVRKLYDGLMAKDNVT